VISATFDTNVYIRAFETGGPAISLLQNAKAGKFRIDVSDAIVDETCRILREKFKWDGYSINDVYHKMLAGNLVVPSETLSVIKEDPDDDRILECAAAARSDYIVSEDKDLLRLGEFRGAKIVNISTFMDVALGRGRRM
jgi:putative PIN family toxin of toxin-antitoxin system